MAPSISKPPKAPASAYVFGIVFLLFVLNYGLVVWLGTPPFIYCSLGGIAWKLYEPIQVWVSLAGMCLLAYGLATKRLNTAFAGAMLTVCAYFIVDAANILFALGRSC